MKKFLLSALLFLPTILMAQIEARLLRFPSTNGKEVTFTYAGDLYSVSLDGGAARRLTSDVGFEMFSRYSPDGKTIAFTAQYDGNTEVYTIPAEGGEPKRITYNEMFTRDDVSDRMGPNNIVAAWSPDGKSITYISKQHAVGFRRLLFQVPAEGGLSKQVELPEGGFCSYSADGKQLAYNRIFREFRTWKYYKGGMADDVWIHDFTTRKTINITNNSAQNIFPMWVENEVFYISDRDRTMNLFSYNLTTKQTEKLTDFKEYDIKFPSHFGSYIVFENGGYIYKFDAKSRKLDKITIYLGSENSYSRSELKTPRFFSSVSLSPNGERLAITARGEVYNVPATEGVTRCLTNTPGVHERLAQWSPDGKWIAYISDQSGETELYIQPALEGGKPIQLTKNGDGYIHYFSWSPDSKVMFYLDHKGNLYTLDVATKQRSLAVKSELGARGVSCTWSPDSKWIAYSKPEVNDMSVVYLYSLEQKKSYPVTDKWYASRSPEFSTDGKYLFFTSSRDFNPVYASNEWNVIYTESDRIYFAVLANDTQSPFTVKDDEVKTAEVKSDAAAKPKDEPAKDMKVDIEGIGNRIEGLPVAVGRYSIQFATSDKVYYSTAGKSKYFDLKAKKETELGDDMWLSLSPNGKKVLVRKGQTLSVVDVPSAKVSMEKLVNTADISASVDYRAEWKQIFEESWRHMRDGFYVRNMHGVNWENIRKRYEVLLPYVNHRSDLTYIIGEMIGELNVGHAYVNNGEAPAPKRIKTGLLGAELSRDKSGYFRIDRILEGAGWSKTLRSPLAVMGVEAKVGEYITSVDGVDVSTVSNIYSLLIGKADKNVELILNTKAAAGGRKVVVTPIASEGDLYYYSWVQNNIRKVEKATNGRVGYIHIPDMGPDGMNEFAKYFYPQLDKEALIIDDRSNGGGNVSPIILERLARVPYRATMYANSNRNGVIPDKTLVGPKVALVDKYSMSDGDLFAYGFQKLGLGKLVGTRTWGGVVGISGSLPFMDGADLRVPFFTSYSIDTGEWIIEGHGVDPDIVLDNDPYKEYIGEDQQLNRAIEEMLKELKDRKPVPNTPADPVR